MPDDDALGVVARATEAWLDLVLMATLFALAPYEWSGQLLTAWAQAVRRDAAAITPADPGPTR